MRKVISAGLVAILALGVRAAVVPGEMNSSFSECKDYSEREGVPLVLVWSGRGCEFCEALESALESQAAKATMKELGYVFCHVTGDATEAAKAAKEFASTANGTKPDRESGKLTKYPFVCAYLPGTGADNFTGRSPSGGYMTADQFFAKVTAIVGDYGKAASFLVGNTAHDRLEAVPGKTTRVFVPLKDFEEADRAAYQIVAKFPRGGGQVTTTDQWVAIPTGVAFQPNDVVTLELLKDGKAVDTSAITFVGDRPDSPENPLWKTERDAETLQYAEWTCDIDTATNKVVDLAAKGTEAWTLVYSHGSQWCPYCYLNGASFVETAAFRQWAVSNRVVLVSADMPHCSDGNPDQDWCTIWHWKSEATDLYFDGEGKVPRSGAGYLSRKMISDADAAAMRSQLRELGTSFLHLPEDYQASRAIIPGLVLIDAAGKVVGRLETFDYNMNNHTDGALAPQYCRRLSEMIRSAKESPDRASENLNDNCETTPLALTLGGEPALGSISHADYRDVYRLNGVMPGKSVRLKVRGARNDAIRLCLLKGDADGTVSEMIKTVTGNLATGVEIDTTQIPGFDFDTADGTYFVRVSCHDIMPTTSSNYRPYRLRWGDNEDDATFDGYKAGYDGNTLTAYEVSAEEVWRPGEISIVECDRRMLERDGGGVFTVTRMNGVSGACRVTLRVESEQNAAGRYELAETSLGWADGEAGAKTVPFQLIDNGQYDEEGQFVVKLEADAGCPARVSDARAKVTIVDMTSPIFEKSRYEVTVYEGFACADEFGVRNLSEKGSVKLTISKSSDKLPSGLKLAYDRKTGVVELTGTPKAKSSGTYATECTVTQNRDTGYPTTFAITVKDPQDFNPFVGVKRVSQVIPMIKFENGLRYVVGTLTVSISAKNKISAKYVGLDVSSVSFSGSWGVLDEKTGVVEAVLEKKEHVLALTMDREGRLEARVDGVVSGAVGVAQTGVFDAWEGYYTVALPCLETDADGVCGGSGYLSLTMTSSSAVKKGQVKFSGKLPSGQSVSGTAQLIPNGDTMLLPVYKRSSKYVIGVLLELYPNGAANWNDPEDVQSREVVNLAEGHVAFCQQIDGGAIRRSLHGAAGSWYPTTVMPGQLAKEFYGDEAQVFQLSVSDGERVSAVAGVVASGKKLVLTEKISGVSISFTAKSGLFKGKAKLVLSDGSAVSGSYAGILVPGWHKNCDCGDGGVELPFGMGTFYYTDRSSGKSVKASFPVMLEILDEEK